MKNIGDQARFFSFQSERNSLKLPSLIPKVLKDLLLFDVSSTGVVTFLLNDNSQSKYEIALDII